MSDNFISNNIPWEDEGQLVNREIAGGGHLGHLRLYGLKVTKSFTSGDYVTIPGVVGGDFDKKDENGNMKFGGWVPGWVSGGDRWLFVLVATKQDKDGESYQVVKQYKNQSDKSDEGHDWGDIIYPAMMKLTKPQREQFATTGFWGQWDDIPTGRNFTNDEDKTFDIMAWGNFQPCASEEKYKQMREGIFGESSGESSGELPDHFGPYPNTWTEKEDLDEMLPLIAKDLAEAEELDNQKIKEIFDKNIMDAPANDGTKVDVKFIMIEAIDQMDIPKPMKQPLYAKIAAYK